MTQEKNKNDNQEQKKKERLSVIIFFAGLLFFIFGVFFVLRPEYHQLKIVKNDIQLVDESIQQKSLEKVRLQKILDERVLGESTSINEKKFTIPDDYIISDVVRLLSDAEGTNIEMDSFGLSPMTPSENYIGVNIQKISVNLSMPQNSLSQILETFEQQKEQIFIVKKVSAEKAKEFNSDSLASARNVLHVNLELETFYANAEQNPEPTEAAEGEKEVFQTFK